MWTFEFGSSRKVRNDWRSVVPLRTFSDVTKLTEAGIEIRFEHTLEPLDAGTRIRHRVTIDGPNAGEFGPAIGAGMVESIPHTVASLAALALQREGS